MKRIGMITIVLTLGLFAVNGFAAGDDKTQGAVGAPMDTIMASDLMDKTIVNTQGDELGTITDLVMDRNGDVSYIILSRDGAMDDQLVPIPWRSAKADLQDDRVVIQMSKDRLDQAPSFSSDDLNESFTTQHQDEVRAYFGDDRTEEFRKTDPTSGPVDTAPGGMDPAPGMENKGQRSPGWGTQDHLAPSVKEELEEQRQQ